MLYFHAASTARYGYLIRRNLLDTALCSRARDELWRSMPPGAKIKRDEPASWVGPVAEEDRLEEDRDTARPDGGHNPTLNNFRWMAHTCGSLDWMKHLLATNDEIMEIAEQLLGKGNVAPVEGVRGVYCTLPYGDHPLMTNELVPGGDVPNTAHGDRESCHNDAHGMHLGIVGLIDTVPPGGGSTMMWPGSHKRVFHKMAQQCMNGRMSKQGELLTGQQGMREDSEYSDALKQVNADTEPVDTCGHAGDVVFCE
eukprot:SAG22_NODE_499_length_9725_cov_2.325784_3_plen_254_part_00